MLPSSPAGGDGNLPMSCNMIDTRHGYRGGIRWGRAEGGDFRARPIVMQQVPCFVFSSLRRVAARLFSFRC
jgi:hypothetical protein